MRVTNAIMMRAMSIKRTLGIKYAAGYLRNRGVSVEAACWMLTR